MYSKKGSILFRKLLFYLSFPFKLKSTYYVYLGWKKISFGRVKRKIRPACRDNLSLSNNWLFHRLLFRCYWKQYLYEFYTGNLEFGSEGCHDEVNFFFLWTKIVLFIIVSLHWKFGPSIWMKLFQNETTKYRLRPSYFIICPSIFTF